MVVGSGQLVKKKTHLGRAGEFAAMAELLLRGYNVAVPSVDVGDDAFVIDDRDSATWRVQVKTGSAKNKKKKASAAAEDLVVQYTISRTALRTERATELYFTFLVRWETRWRYVLIARTELAAIREEQAEAKKRSKRRGAKPLSDTEAKRDELAVEITWTTDDAVAWGRSLKSFLDSWPAKLPPITDGPGATNPASPP